MSEACRGLIRLSSAKTTHPETGLSRQVLAFNPDMMLIRHQMQPGWRGARHSHPHQQMVYIVKGHIHFVCGTEAFDAYAGDSFIVPGDVEHEASAVTESEVLDFFLPYREDYAR
jgi:quercetin dioxygenase-like cupin family protein